MNEEEGDLIGQTVAGRFRVTGRLGDGAMATVYRAEQDGEPPVVALKIMHPHLLRDPTFARRFLREAKAAAAIEHPASVRIVDHGHDGHLHYLAMELLEGQDLFDTLARERRLGEARAVRIVMEVTEALSVAHGQGIVHRDLKPENVFLLHDPSRPDRERVKVLDFGIAKVLEAERARDEAPTSSGDPSSAPPSSVLTRVGTILGTPEYMSPEQSMGLPVDPRADVYACGVLLYHMITGRPPFQAPTPIEVMMQQAEGRPPSPSSIQPGLNPRLEKIVLRALAKLPEHRHQSARDLREALASVLPELGAPPSGPVSSGHGASLPGVPGEVVIAEERGPETMRSRSNDPAPPPKATDAAPPTPSEGRPPFEGRPAPSPGVRTDTLAMERRPPDARAPAPTPPRATSNPQWWVWAALVATLVAMAAAVALAARR